jgi:hypothetical protein
VAASLSPAPRGDQLCLSLWYSPPLEVVLGLRPWVDAVEGHLALPGRPPLLWQAVDMERGLREALRQSLAGLAFWSGHRLEHGPGWPANSLPEVICAQLRGLAGGALHGGALATLEASARGLWAAGQEGGALRLARMGLVWAGDGVLCGDDRELGRRRGAALPQALEALSVAVADAAPGGAPSYEALGQWLVRARQAARAQALP